MGLRPNLSSRWHQLGFAAVFQPVALAANVDGRRVMQQPIQNRSGDDRITVSFRGGEFATGIDNLQHRHA
jgi:hypothetical protein